ncbi:hypothetical protein [Mycobacterium sp. MMS18-G62]
MGWFDRARKASAGQRVTRSDVQRAMTTFDELNALNAERQRLMRDGLAGTATITDIHENVATTSIGTWHELVLDVQVPNRDPYRATRRVSVELSASPHIRVGAQVPVRVDPQDRSKVLVNASP